MSVLRAVAFSVSVDNEAEIRQWIGAIAEAKGAMEAQFEAFVDLCRNSPLIQLTLHRQEDGE